MHPFYVTYADNVNVDPENIEWIYFRNSSSSGGSPQIIDEHYKKSRFDFETHSSREIEYIMHYLNSFNLEDDGKTYGGGDIPLINIIMATKENIFNVGFVRGRFYDFDGKQYAISANEYNRFIEFVYALKTEKIVLNDEITLGASEWAEKYIAKAIECELVPRWNQIDYRGDITRLEACQLIDNFLERRGYVTESMNTNTFSDINDMSINCLYEYDIVEGKETEKFYPYDNLTREEFAKMLSKIYHFIKKGAGSINDENVYLDDTEISEWAKLYVSEMTELGVLRGEDNGYFNPQGKITKEQVIIALLRLHSLCQGDGSLDTPLTHN